MYCIEESTCNIVGTFRAPSDTAPRALRSPFPLVTPYIAGMARGVGDTLMGAEKLLGKK